jgi:superoxide dismutase
VQTMQSHHGKHHQAYAELECRVGEAPDLQSRSVEELCRG